MLPEDRDLKDLDLDAWLCPPPPLKDYREVKAKLWARGRKDPQKQQPQRTPHVEF